MFFDGFDADLQNLCDLFSGVTFRNQAQDLKLTRAERVEKFSFCRVLDNFYYHFWRHIDFAANYSLNCLFKLCAGGALGQEALRSLAHGALGVLSGVMDR